MPKKGRYAHLKGSSAYYPFGARTTLRKRQRRHVVLLRVVGLVLFVPVAALVIRQVAFRGGQPRKPESVPFSAYAETAENSGPVATPAADAPVTVTVLPADSAAENAGLSGMPSTAEASKPAAPDSDSANKPARQILPQYQELYQENPDMVGWLTVEAADIDYPVVQTPGDNEYYLRRGFDGLYSMAGTLFLDEQCSLYDPATANWIIYGHNMNDGSMFGQLALYEEESFYQEHPTFSFDTLYEEMEFEIVAVIYTKLGSDALPYYTFFDASDETEWQQRYDAVMQRELYDTGVEAQYGDQLLTLSTCGDTNEDRLAVIAKRIR